MKPQGRLRDPAFCPKDSHACPISVHPVIGPAIDGSGDVHVNSRPALRDGDPGIHLACCGPNTWKADGGSSTVIINSRKAFRRGDPTKHCGGTGKLFVGSSDVLVGDHAVSPQVAAMRSARGVPFCEECERKRKAQEERDEPVPDPLPEMLGEAKVEADDASGDAMLTDLAAQADTEGDDEGNELRRRARKLISEAFYLDECPGMSSAQIEGHLDGIDVSQPVQVVDIEPGAQLLQRGGPGLPNGQYFTRDPAISPEEVGVSSTCYAVVDGVVGPPEVNRDHRVVTFEGYAPVPALQTTAAPMDDTWSLKQKGKEEPERVVPCPGGGTQVMVPRGHQACTTTEIVGGGG